MSETKVFDAAAATELVKELRGSFGSGNTRSYEWRVAQLESLLKLSVDHEEDICDALRSDLSKPALESVIHEISMVKSSCKLALKELRNWMTPEKVQTTITSFPSSAAIVPEPLGVVLIISAWNYPFYLSLDPVVGAIAAGNAVVLKPSEISPATASLIAKLLEKYLDTSAVKVVEGAIPETSALLEQKWDKIFYTGNGRVGRIVMAAAAKHLTPVVLELGGKSPVVVDSKINLQVACRRIISGKWGGNNGQACVSPDYIITTKEFAPKLVESLKQELERFYGKNPLESKDISRIVNASHFNRLTKLLDDDEVSSKIVHGGEKDKTKLQIAPTLLLDVPRDSLIMTEEIFGPLLPIITVDKLEDSFEIVNSGSKPLAAYLFTNNKKLKEQFVACISAGGVVINDTTLHLAVSTLPFGGVGESGMGSCHGKFSFDAFSHKKAVLYRSFVGDVPMRYPPYTNGKLRFLKALLGGGILELIRALLGWSHFTVFLNIGNPPKVFELDIDTGSDLTWVQCDVQCNGCTLPRDMLYRPHNNAVSREDPLCVALSSPAKALRKNTNDDQCDYEVEYADHGSSIGVLVKDLVPMRLTNGKLITPNLGFGCGYDQENGDLQPPPSVGGVLGLSSSKATIVSQLSDLGHVSNVVGHCLAGRGGGFLFFGEDLVPSSKLSWTPILRNSEGKYSSGPAEIYFGGRATGIGGFTLTFDSGSSYTYFNSQVYGAVTELLKNDLKGQPLELAPDDKTLELCWKGSKAFESVVDVRNFFKALALSFKNSKNVQFQIPPEAYLIISKFGNVCLGILDGTKEGLGNVNLIGDISMLNKIVVYDNQRQQIGWASENCSKPPKNEASW